MIAEWLRRWTCNPRGISRAGSKPARSVRSFFFRNLFGRSWEHEPILVLASNWDWRIKDSQLLFLERTCRRQRLETTITKTLSKKSKISASKNLSEDGIGFHQNKINVKIAMITQWLRRWTRNPMGTSCARSSPARSLRSHFSKRYSEKVGNTNQYLCSQTTETDEPKIRNYFSWTGHVGDSVWKRPAWQSSAKKSKISGSKKLSTDGIKFHQNTNNVKRAVMAEWLRRWTWNPMEFPAQVRSLLAAFNLVFSDIYSEEVGNTNQYLCSQATETDEPKILYYFSRKGHVGDTVWKRPPRQSSAKNRTIMQAKNSPRTEFNSIKLRIRSIKLWWPRG